VAGVAEVVVQVDDAAGDFFPAAPKL